LWVLATKRGKKKEPRKFLTASTMVVESQQKVDIGPQSTLISTMNVLLTASHVTTML